MDETEIKETQLTELDVSPDLTPDLIKWERDLFRDVLNNVNQTIRFQISLAVPLLAACVTVLNIIPPQDHQELLNELDRWVFIPALVSIALGYYGLEKHCYVDKKLSAQLGNIEELYELVKFKNMTVRAVISLQAIAISLMMIFVLLEYK